MCFSHTLFAGYKIFTNKSEPFHNSSIQKKESIFFGELQEYQKSLAEIEKSLVLHGTIGTINGISNQSANLAKGLLGEGLRGAGAGIAIGVIVGALDPYIMDFYADQYYIEIYKITLTNGKTVFMNTFFIGDKHPELSKEEIKNILRDHK